MGRRLRKIPVFNADDLPGAGKDGWAFGAGGKLPAGASFTKCAESEGWDGAAGMRDKSSTL